MKDKYFMLFPLLFVTLLALFVTSITVYGNNSYGKVQLRSFNKINGTHYTMDEWRIYEYQIKELHPFIEAKP